MKKRLTYHLFPPYVDAYEHSSFKNGIDLDLLKSRMEDYATTWNKEIQDYAEINSEPIPMCMDKYVLCCAYVYEDYFEKDTYLIVVDNLEGDWMERLEFIKSGINKSWDNT